MIQPPFTAISEFNQVLSFFTFLHVIDNLNFHPDTPFADYIDKDKKPVYTAQEAATRTELLQQCFKVCKQEGADIYAMAGKAANNSIAKYHNEEFRNDLMKDVYLPSEYGYVIDFTNDGRAEYYELTIVTTSMSELDGAEEGIVAHYQYSTRNAAEMDMETANKYSFVEFHEV